MIMRKLFLLFLCIPVVFSQSSNHYYVFRAVSADTNRITVRQPTSGGKPLQLAYVWLKSSVTCPFAITKNGTVSGGSPGSAINMDERGKASSSAITLDGTVSGDVNVFSDSLAASVPQGFDGVLYLPYSSSSPKQFTVEQTCSGSGSLSIYVEWREP